MNHLRTLKTTGRRVGPPFVSFLLWVLFAQLLVFAGFVVVQEGLWGKVLVADQSKICLLIVAVFVVASCYVGWRLFVCCCYLERMNQLLGRCTVVYSPFHFTLVNGYLADMNALEQGQDKSSFSPATYLLEIYVDRLRGALDLVSFGSDTLIRLGLIGTIVGFILMLQSFVAGPLPSDVNIQTLLLTMSSGMGTALYTTFTGLVGAILLGGQHLMLSHVVEAVIGGLIRLSHSSHPIGVSSVDGADL